MTIPPTTAQAFLRYGALFVYVTSQRIADCPSYHHLS